MIRGYEKMVRDRIRDFSIEKNDGRRFRKPDTEAERIYFLRQKVQEEAREVCNTTTNEELIEESGICLPWWMSF